MTYAACGILGESLTQFIITTLATGVAYTAIFLTLFIKLGQAVAPVLEHWVWVFLFAFGLTIITIKLIRQRKVSAVTDNNYTFSVDSLTATIPVSAEPDRQLKGMPSIKHVSKKVALSEKIPPFIFYSPVAIRWFLLGLKYRSLLLPTVSNPLVEAGGLWGESKSRLMDIIGKDQRNWIAPYTTVVIEKDKNDEEILQSIRDAMKNISFTYPVVVKPDIGWQGYGVRAVSDDEEMKNYLVSFPRDNILILQELLPWEGEAGIFYSRLPGEEQGRIISLTLRYYPHVVGDGSSTVRDLINLDERTRFKLRFYKGKDSLHSGLSEEQLNYAPAADEVYRLAFIGSIRVGGLYRNGSEYITEALQKRFNAIGKSMPEFYFGRFDIKFKTLETLMEGEEFRIFEVNGAGAEAIHVWDASTPLLEMYRELFRYQSLMFEISDRNRTRGFEPMRAGEFFRFTRKYNSLISSYPASE